VRAVPTPPKPFSVLSSEKKSHRTKSELRQREQAEKALATGENLKEKPEVKKNPIAHKEFLRLNRLLKTIEKNDAIYETIINRYCVLYAECFDLEAKRDETYMLMLELKNTFYELVDDMAPAEKAMNLIEFTKNMSRMTASMINIDKLIQQKRKMLLDIEKENIMTIASALRSIPKKVEKSSNKLLEALNGS
jgi:hypothetical protein